jgi:hypothetical protein
LSIEKEMKNKKPQCLRALVEIFLHWRGSNPAFENKTAHIFCSGAAGFGLTSIMIKNIPFMTQSKVVAVSRRY